MVPDMSEATCKHARPGGETRAVCDRGPGHRGDHSGLTSGGVRIQWVNSLFRSNRFKRRGTRLIFKGAVAYPGAR